MVKKIKKPLQSKKPVEKYKEKKIVIKKDKTPTKKPLITKTVKLNEKNGGPISDIFLQTKLNNIFNKKVNKKTNGEVGIRTSTFLKEIGSYDFTEDQIKMIGDMLMDNNVKLSGKADKFKSNLSTYLLENVVEAKIDSGGANSNGIIKRMFETLAASKPLTPLEEKKYIKMLGSKNDKIRKLGRDTLITSNLRLVASIARRHINKGVQLEDLILEGYLGLIKTIDKFD
jgi:RNA polymerase primary sigma factor